MYTTTQSLDVISIQILLWLKRNHSHVRHGAHLSQGLQYWREAPSAVCPSSQDTLTCLRLQVCMLVACAKHHTYTAPKVLPKDLFVCDSYNAIYDFTLHGGSICTLTLRESHRATLRLMHEKQPFVIRLQLYIGRNQTLKVCLGRRVRTDGIVEYH